MAGSGVICTGCGALLAPGSRVCSRCGATQESAGAAGPKASGQPPRCKECGHEVRPASRFCEACGAPLADMLPSERKRRERSRSGRLSGFRFEPWQLMAGVILVFLVAFFAYTELGREHGAQTGVPASMPAVSPPIPAGALREIERLQQQVRENPNDKTSLLALANMLHDAGSQDPGLLPGAIETYGRYLVFEPGDANARVDMGICYFELGRRDSVNAGAFFSRAIEEMQRAITGNPRHQPAAFNLGIVNLHTGDIEESNRWFRKAADLDPASELGQRAKQLLDQHTFQTTQR